MTTFSEATLTKARKMIAAGKITQDPEYPVTWWVSSASGGDTYRVQSDFNPATRELTWCSCTCMHGRNTRAGTAHCWHVAAVLMLLRQEGTSPDTTPPDVVLASRFGQLLDVGPRL